MSEYFGRVPSIDVLARMGEIDASFAEKKLGQTPQDVQSLAWGFQQSTIEKPLNELGVGDYPNLISQFTQASLQSGHPQAGANGSSGATGGQGPPGPPGPPGQGAMDCGDVCECIEQGCDGPQETEGACCRAGGLCSYVTPSECAELSGTFIGFGISCEQASCYEPPGPGGTSDWDTDDGGGGGNSDGEGNSTSIDWSDPNSDDDGGDSEDPPGPDSGEGSGPGIGPGPGPKPQPPKPPIIEPSWPWPGTDDDDDPHGHEGCITRNQGGSIVVPKNKLPDPSDVQGCCCGDSLNAPPAQCAVQCSEHCFDDYCVPPHKQPDCKAIPVSTTIFCPCGNNEQYGEWDPNPAPGGNPPYFPPPVPARPLPGGGWEFDIPSGCCCNGQHPPDTDGDGILSSGVIDPTPNQFNTWPFGEVCIQVVFELRCSAPEMPPEGWEGEEAACCWSGLAECENLFNGVVAAKMIEECEPCC